MNENEETAFTFEKIHDWRLLKNQLALVVTTNKKVCFARFDLKKVSQPTNDWVCVKLAPQPRSIKDTYMDISKDGKIAFVHYRDRKKGLHLFSFDSLGPLDKYTFDQLFLALKE